MKMKQICDVIEMNDENVMNKRDNKFKNLSLPNAFSGKL